MGSEASELGPQLTQLAIAREEQEALEAAYVANQAKNNAFAKTFNASLKNTSKASEDFTTFKDYSFQGYSF